MNASALSFPGSVFWDAIAAAPIVPPTHAKLAESVPGVDGWSPPRTGTISRRSAPAAGTCLTARPVLLDADGDVDQPSRGAAARALLLDA
jgi:hypothetical protein